MTKEEKQIRERLLLSIEKLTARDIVYIQELVLKLVRVWAALNMNSGRAKPKKPRR